MAAARPRPALRSTRKKRPKRRCRLVTIQGAFRAREWTDKSTGEVKTSYEIEVETGTGIVPVLERKKEKANADR